jgi:uncharacterized protein with GYD domain
MPPRLLGLPVKLINLWWIEPVTVGFEGEQGMVPVQSRRRPIFNTTPIQRKDRQMAKYLYYGNYVGEGLKGLLKEGGSGRIAAMKEVAESVGGKLECCYFAFGEYDYFIIVDVPDNVSAASISLTANASGLVKSKTLVLMTPEEMDQVAKKSPKYRGPGQ